MTSSLLLFHLTLHATAPGSQATSALYSLLIFGVDWSVLFLVSQFENEQY